MIDQTFLMPPEDGTRVRAKIIQRVNDYKDGMMDDPELAAKITKFRCLINDEYEEGVYNIVLHRTRRHMGRSMEVQGNPRPQDSQSKR
jgi:hypothetical protein